MIFWELSQGSFLQQRASPRKHWQLKVAGTCQYTMQVGKDLPTLKEIQLVHHSIHFSQHQRESRKSSYRIKLYCCYFSLKMAWEKTNKFYNCLFLLHFLWFFSPAISSIASSCHYPHSALLLNSCSLSTEYRSPPLPRASFSPKE